MEDNRSSPRFVKRLRAVLNVEEKGKQTTIHGKTQDVSITGVSFISELNLAIPQSATVFLLISPGEGTKQPVVFEAQCNIVSSVLSPQQGGFRLGIAFTKVAGEGKQVLQKLLVARMAQTT